MTFTWDEEKDIANQEKHEISFSEVTILFNMIGTVLEWDDEVIMPNLKEAMKLAKETKKPQVITALSAEEPIVKVNTSIRLDFDVIEWLKNEAKSQGIPYTTLANSILKKASHGNSDWQISKTVNQMEKKIGELEKRMDSLSKKSSQKKKSAG